MEKSIDEINQRIRDGSARVVTADEMPGIVSELGEEGALREVDVVTTGTFGAMCSSGAFLNFGHAEPPIKMERIWLNDVDAYGGIAAVDTYIGATNKSVTRAESYGGAHVIEDFIAGKSVELRAQSSGSDCYPRRSISTEIRLEDLNQAIMVNPRNAYQRYDAATNTSEDALFTYMGTLLPNSTNVTYSGAGTLNPICNDPTLRLIGSGVPLLLGGAPGMVIGEGTQHSSSGNFGTLMTTADMNEMSTEYLRAAYMYRYGPTLYLGVGIPLPVLDIDVVRRTAVRDEDLMVSVKDYGVPSRSRPALRQVSYAELKSGRIELNGEEVRTSSLSSYRNALKVARTLKHWVEEGQMTLCLPTRRIDPSKQVKPMRETRTVPLVQEIMQRKVVTIKEEEEITEAARKLLRGETNHLPVLNEQGRLVGVVTTFDVAKAVAHPGRKSRVKDVMTRNVITTRADEPIDIAGQKLEHHRISALPVVDAQNQCIAILHASDLGKLFRPGGMRE
ncbi:MAG TPA: homocysteine biosynthesis protein [Methanospirillum sp.]|nr:homocysteine biosynthesis protein [Methanospirillum sp.]